MEVFREESRSNQRETLVEEASRRTVLRRLGAGATATTGLTSVPPVSAGVQGAGKLDITGVDPQNFPNITISCVIGTEAGRAGKITEGDFQVIEKLPGSDPQPKSCTGFQTGGGSADIVFVFDDTGSMSEEISTMKRKVMGLTDEVEAAGIDARYGLVTFKDEEETDTQFTDATSLKQSVDRLQARGGGDAPEANFDAIETALGFTFRSDALKLIVDITDSVAHYRGDGTEFADYTLEEVATDLRERGIAFVAVVPDFSDQFGSSVIQNRSLRYLTQQVNGTWIDIRGADFGQILDDIILDVRTTYKCSYKTDAPAEQSESAGKVGVTVNDPTGKLEIPPSSEDAGKLSVPEAVKEPATCRKPNGEPAVRDNIAVFLTETGEQLTSQNTDEEGTVNFDIPIEHTQDRVDVVYYQIFDKDPSTVEFEFPLPDRDDARIAGETDGSPDMYAVTRTTAAETGGVVEVDLPEAYKLDVQVVDSAENPLPNVQTNVIHRNGETDASGGIFTFTNSDGFATLPEGDDTGLEVRGRIQLQVADPETGDIVQERDLGVVDQSTTVTLTVG